jgi:ribosomal protein L16/L10AE
MMTSFGKRKKERSFKNATQPWLVRKVSVLSLNNKLISANQVEAMRKSITRYGKQIRKQITFVREVHYAIPVTSKPVGSRMGKGKGVAAGNKFIVKKHDSMYSLQKVSAWHMNRIRKLVNGKSNLKFTYTKGIVIDDTIRNLFESDR